MAMLLGFCTAVVQAAPKIVEVRTAAPKVLVVVLKGDLTWGKDNVTTSPETLDENGWRVNGVAPTNVHRYSITWDEGKGTAWNESPPNTNSFPITNLHRLYLMLSNPLVEGQSYSISNATQSAYGSINFVFGARTIFCESIKVNQVGYSKLSTSRYANFGVYMGDGGSIFFNPAPTYKVYHENTGALVTNATAIYMANDTGLAVSNSGEHVYRLNLNGVPEGGPYYVSVDGAGRSRSFGVGDAYNEMIARVTMRGIYLHRCGIALTNPYTAFVHAICHTNIYDVRSPNIVQDTVFVNTNMPRMYIEGGYHDAGDMDHPAANPESNPGHTLISTLMLSFYEAFPDRFVDNQYDIPESGNGIPDFLDEIMWGLKVWEYLQVTNTQDSDYRGVRSGWSMNEYPTYGVDDAANDGLVPERRDPPHIIVYGTQQVRPDSTAYVAGTFAQASRLIRPFDTTKANALLNRAQLAWAYLGSHTNEARTSVMYAALQLYLATTNNGYHTIFQTAANNIIFNGNGYDPARDWYECGNSYPNCQIAHFVSYLLPNVPSPNATLVQNLKNKILGCAETGIFMGPPPENQPYPQGFTGYLGLGAGTAQGRYAAQWMYACLFTNNPTTLQRYTNTVAQYADYPLGLNPMNMSYYTGLGVDQPNSPLDCNSYFTKYGTNDGVTRRPDGSLEDFRINGAPIGNVPGIVVYGPSWDEDFNPRSLFLEQKMIPYWTSLPGQRRYTHGHTFPAINEFSVSETMTWNTLMYAFLYRPAGGGTRPGVTAQRTTAPITINGNLSEAGWVITNTVTKTIIGTTNNTVTFGVLWDTNYLYVGARVLDANLFFDSAPYPWQDDSLEIYIDGNHNRGTSYDAYDRQIVKGWNNPTLRVNGNQINGILHASALITGGYSVEIAIPWSNLGVTPTSGAVLGLDVASDDDDNGTDRESQVMWAGNNNNWTDTSAFGDLTLVGPPPPEEFTNDANTIALYHFNGSYNDSSGNGYHLTASGNVMRTTNNLAWMQNPTGEVARFSDLDDQLNISTVPDSAVEPGPSQTPLSIEARIFVRGYKAYDRANVPLISLYQDWDARLQLYDPIYPAQGQPIGPAVVGDTWTIILSASQWQAAVSLNAWHKFKITFAADGTAKCYVDDNLLSTVATSVLVSRTNPWIITLGIRSPSSLFEAPLMRQATIRRRSNSAT